MPACGNWADKMDRRHLENSTKDRIIIKKQEMAGLKSTFGPGRPGELVAIRDSFDLASMRAVKSRAAHLFNTGAGEIIEADRASS